MTAEQIAEAIEYVRSEWINTGVGEPDEALLIVVEAAGREAQLREALRKMCEEHSWDFLLTFPPESFAEDTWQFVLAEFLAESVGSENG